MRIEFEKLALIDAALAEFIYSLAGVQPVSKTLLQVDGELLEKLVSNPSPALRQSWQNLGRQKFKRVSASRLANSGRERPVFRVTPALVGLAVVLNNQIALRAEFFNNQSELTTSNDQSLLKLLPVPRNFSDILSFDLLISEYCHLLRADTEPSRLNSLQIDLLNFSPFSALTSIDLNLPQPLVRLAPDYLPHRLAVANLDEMSVWWNLVDEILAEPILAATLKNVWLELPENRLSCLGLGIFLEEIRRRGQNDDFILSFFEAYEFLRKIKRIDSADTARIDLIDLIKSQLSASGENLSGRRLNQVGNEYFLKFRALLEIIAARGGVPGEFRHLSHNFCSKCLLPLVSKATITGGERSGNQTLTKFSEVKFS